MTNSLNFIVDRFEGQMAVLRGDEGLELRYPKKHMPKEAREGSTVVVSVDTLESDRSQREKTAKELLREILKAK